MHLCFTCCMTVQSWPSHVLHHLVSLTALTNAALLPIMSTSLNVWQLVPCHKRACTSLGRPTDIAKLAQSSAGINLPPAHWRGRSLLAGWWSRDWRDHPAVPWTLDWTARLAGWWTCGERDHLAGHSRSPVRGCIQARHVHLSMELTRYDLGLKWDLSG